MIPKMCKALHAVTHKTEHFEASGFSISACNSSTDCTLAHINDFREMAKIVTLSFNSQKVLSQRFFGNAEIPRFGCCQSWDLNWLK